MALNTFLKLISPVPGSCRPGAHVVDVEEQPHAIAAHTVDERERVAHRVEEIAGMLLS
jgi:hypothetical protein